MYRFYHLLTFLILLWTGACSEQVNPEFIVENLKCEYMKEAIVAKSAPRFSWEISSTQSAQNQTFWQIIVSDDLKKIETSEGNIWDSGKSKGNESFGIKWQGTKLESFTKYYWKVRAWDRDGKRSNWSETETFISGAFHKEDWKANWIGDQPEEPLKYPLLYKHIGYLSSYTDQSEDEKWVQ